MIFLNLLRSFTELWDEQRVIYINTYERLLQYLAEFFYFSSIFAFVEDIRIYYETFATYRQISFRLWIN